MKNIAYSLCMIFLFGILCPSYQAYAKGIEPSSTLEKINFKKIFNDDLIDKLAKSKIFEELYYKAFIFATYANLNLITKSEKQLKIDGENLNELTNKKEVTIKEVIEIYKIIGFEYNADMQNFLAKINELRSNLLIQFPELNKLNTVEKEYITEGAITKANLLNKVQMLLDKNSCFQDSSVKYTECLSQNKWYKIPAAAVTGVCIVAWIACVAIGSVAVGAADVITDGLAIGVTLTYAQAVARYFIPYCLECVKYGFGAFGVTLGISAIPAPSDACSNEFKERTAACVAQFGAPSEGGNQ